jgi:hypothetical protein
MQTFLPYDSFTKTAEVLDYRRLGKQRIEAMQIINAAEMRRLGIDRIYIVKEKRYKATGWYNHPATVTWENYIPALKHYCNLMIIEWIKRGYKNTMSFYDINQPIVIPPFIGNEKLHASHRSNLLRKDYKYYSQFGWTESPDMPYYWPDSK